MSEKSRKINYNENAEKVRWPRLMAELKQLPLQERRMLLWKATSYKSGENDIGSVYMGGLDHARLHRVLGASLADDDTYKDLIWRADEEVLDLAFMIAMHTIEYMLSHPMKRCKCCGQILPEE